MQGLPRGKWVGWLSLCLAVLGHLFDNLSGLFFIEFVFILLLRVEALLFGCCLMKKEDVYRRRGFASS